MFRYFWHWAYEVWLSAVSVVALTRCSRGAELNLDVEKCLWAPLALSALQPPSQKSPDGEKASVSVLQKTSDSQLPCLCLESYILEA